MKHPALFRWPVITVALIVIVYYAVTTAAAPEPPFEIQILPTGQLKVYPPVEPATHLMPGDIILSINGWPTSRYVDWRWLFAGAETHRLEIQRDGQALTVDVARSAPELDRIVDRLMVHLAALATALIGALILMLALPDNRRAWRVSYVFLGMGVVVAAFGSLLRAPGSRAGFELLMPVIGVAFAELAGLEDEGRYTIRQRVAQGLAYGLALLLTLGAFVDITLLSPQGQSIFTLTGLPLLRVQVFWGAACLLMNPILLAWRYWRTPPSSARQSSRLLLAGTGLAVTPLFVLVLLRTVELIPPVENWEWTVLMLAVLAATYGYAIYRHRYLGLDFVATRAVSLLVLGLIGGGLFALATTLLDQTFAWVIAAGLILLAPAAWMMIERAVRTVLYGRGLGAANLPAIVYRLSTAPEAENIRAAFRETLARLQVGRGALLLLDARGELQCLDSVNVSEAECATLRMAAMDLMGSPLTQVQLNADGVGWVRLAVKVEAQGQSSGWMLLGPRIPDDVYNDFHIAFTQQVAHAIGLAHRAALLFEASRAFSRQLMQAREAERLELATRLHDDPLQKITAAANSLELLALRASHGWSPEALAEAARNQQLLREVTAELRALCAGLRPPALDAGLPFIVQCLEQRLRDEHLVVQTKLNLGRSEIREPVVTALYHILTEAANNITKHAHARRAWIRVEQCDGRLVCAVEDDGVGMNAPALNVNDLIRSRHFGLVGMHDWAATIGATLTIRPRPGGSGTRVQLACYTESVC